MGVRPPAVAGMFYPGERGALRAAVDSLLDAARAGSPAASAPTPVPAPKALVLPHAGYRYSGPMAAAGYAALPSPALPSAAPPSAAPLPAAPLPPAAPITRVVLLGPCHRVGLPALALPGAEALATPLGEVPVWIEGARRAAEFPQVAISPAAHAEEHSLEVHLPFIQRALGQVEVLPLAVGWVTPEQVAQVLDAVWGGPETLIAVSSDLSHYLPYGQALRTDAASIAQILALGPPLDHDQACGATPVNGLLAAAPGHGLAATEIGRCNSGDTSGDRSRVVGYAAIRFDAPPPGREGAPDA